MSIIRRPSPFGELLSLRQAMDRIFEDSFVRPRTWLSGEIEGGTLPLDIYTTKDALVVRAALPGMKPDDVDITVTGNALTISARYEDEQREEEPAYLFRELRRGSCSRTVTLPDDVDPNLARASFEHGVLTLTIPKTETAKPRQIRITTAGTAVTAAAADLAPAEVPAGDR